MKQVGLQVNIGLNRPYFIQIQSKSTEQDLITTCMKDIFSYFIHKEKATAGRIQITIVLVIIFSRYWSKSIIRCPNYIAGCRRNSRNSNNCSIFMSKELKFQQPAQAQRVKTQANTNHIQAVRCHMDMTVGHWAIFGRILFKKVITRRFTSCLSEEIYTPAREKP